MDIEITRVKDYYASAVYEIAMNSGPEVINSNAFDSIIRMKHSLWYDIEPIILKKHPGYEDLIENCLFEKKEWIERNQIMVKNIINASKEYPGKRLIVITGASHRYILRELLKEKSTIDLKEYWEIADQDIKSDSKKQRG